MYYTPENPQPSSIPVSTMTSLLLNTLAIPPQQRKLVDHQFVFQFFHTNKHLSDIERLKSLNAKQQCVANLRVETKLPKPDTTPAPILIDEIVVIEEEGSQEKESRPRKAHKDEKRIETKYYVLLDAEKEKEILGADQKHLRRNIEKLKTYMILKDLKYGQMLHLAYYMDEISFKYKEEVYREGDDPAFLYLAEKGEFSYSKTMQDPSIAVNSIQKQSKSRPKRYDANKVDNPNRLKNSKSTELVIGIIQGSTGQSFGAEEIISEVELKDGDFDNRKVKRQYTVKCLSTQNLVIRIPEQNYKRVISADSVTKIDWVKRYNHKKLQLKDEMLNRIIEVKHNYKKYAEIISKASLSRTEQLRIENELEKPYSHMLSDLVSNRSHLPRIKSQSMASNEHYIAPHLQQFMSKNRGNTNDNDTDRNEIFSPKIMRSRETEQNDDEENTFLTKGESKRRKYEDREITQPLNSNGSNGSLLPTIVTEKSRVSAQSGHDYTETPISKNWSNHKPLLQLRGLRNKFSGMIDATSLVKYKEDILNAKLGGKEVSNEIFPADFLDKQNNYRSNFSSGVTPSIISKKQAREFRSAVHSKIFMQKLLVEALRKAGYNSEKKQADSYYADDSPDSIVDIKNNLRVPKSRVRLEREKQRERQREREKQRVKEKEKEKGKTILQENDFDDCYFRKI